MKFKTEKNRILKTTQKVQSAISAKTTLPILSNILIETQKNTLKMTATDLDIGITSTTEMAGETDGAITIPAKKFLDIIKELPEGQETTITAKKNNTITIECGKILVKIIGLPKDEFPQPPSFKNKDLLLIPQNLLKIMLSMTSFAASTDETRYVLNGILFVVKKKTIRLVATDGRRLAVVERDLPQQTIIEKTIIIPTKTVQELQKLLDETGDVKVFFDENQVLFDIGETQIISRLIEGEFPHYEQVIPQENKEKVIIEKEALLAATKRASLFTNQDSMAVKMDISKGKMAITKNTPYMGEVKEELGVSYKGKDVAVGFNPNYIIEVLKNIHEKEVGLELWGSDKPGVIRLGSEYVYVVLPMQVS